jgi:hypothetical protein
VNNIILSGSSLRPQASCLLACLLLAGCMTQQAYEGPRLDRDEVAHISGDLRFTAGAPVSALLRQVDGRALGISQSGVDVNPGSHQLLVDCVVREAGTTSRFSLDVDVSAGQRYRLVAEVGSAREGCVAVHLEAQD